MALFRMKPHYRKRGGTLSYYGTTSEGLITGVYALAATSVGNYALFSGGVYYSSGNYYPNYYTAYNSSLIRTYSIEGVTAAYLAATSVGNYALFGGGVDSGNRVNRVLAYDSSLTYLGNAPDGGLSSPRHNLAATSIGNYALFGGGSEYYNDSTQVDAYNTSLIHTLPSALTYRRSDLAATSVGNYALFGGGHAGSSNMNIVDVYNTSLTKLTSLTLAVARYLFAATSVGNYALFGGGSGYSSQVDAYDTALTHITAPNLSLGRFSLAATSVGSYALFGGGTRNGAVNGTNRTDIVDAYDAHLIYTICAPFTTRRTELAATSIGNYALFGGGDYDSYNFPQAVEVYQVT